MPPVTKPLDPLLESDIDALTGTVSSWLRRSATTEALGADAAAVAASLTSRGGQTPDPDRHVRIRLRAHRAG
ncbi:hypothetical protein ACWD1Y_22755 [Streptomyces sp. NPDC002814]